jgi:hypothetical protein
MTFFNTIHETGNKLRQSIQTTVTQEQKVLDYFLRHPDMEFTPAEVFSAGVCGSAPITSVRRAITNLTKDMLLTRCNSQKAGLYGKVNFTWRLDAPRPYKQGKLL